MAYALEAYSASTAIYVVVLVALCVLLMYARTARWGVPFTPLQLLRTLVLGGEPSGRSPTQRLNTFIGSGTQNILRLRRAGAWCNEATHVYGRALTLYGFMGLTASAVLGFISYQAGASPLVKVFLLFEAASGLVFALGGLTLLARRLYAPNIRAVTHVDTWATHVLVSVLGASCVASSVYGALGPQVFSGATHLLTLGVLGVLLLYAPFSELTFLIWKGSLLTLKALSADTK